MFKERALSEIDWLLERMQRREQQLKQLRRDIDCDHHIDTNLQAWLHRSSAEHFSTQMRTICKCVDMMQDHEETEGGMNHVTD